MTKLIIIAAVFRDEDGQFISKENPPASVTDAVSEYVVTSDMEEARRECLICSKVQVKEQGGNITETLESCASHNGCLEMPPAIETAEGIIGWARN